MFKFFKRKGRQPAEEEYKKILEDYQDIIRNSMKPYIEIKAKESTDLKLWQSKIAGQPYLPKGTNYPKNNKGEYLYLLAQINFEEMPKLELYPEKGLLQFWIADDETYGLDFDDFDDQTKQDSFRIMYYPDINEDNLEQDFSFLPELKYSPFDNTGAEYGIEFFKKEMPVGTTDYQFDKIFANTSDDFYEAYAESYDDSGHRVGGYAYFTQNDPRNCRDGNDIKNILLLQIDSDDENQIMWGDCGVANFFISEKDLKNKDFSSVLYNWDCC